MMRNNRWRVALFMVLLSGSMGSIAGQMVTTSELVQQPNYQIGWQKMVKHQSLPDWARKGMGTSTPAETVAWQGQSYQIGHICKPHDCANNFLIVVFNQDRSQAWGVRVAVANQPAAIEHPKQYATYQWLGKPNDEVKALLKKQFESNPNWK